VNPDLLKQVLAVLGPSAKSLLALGAYLSASCTLLFSVSSVIAARRFRKRSFPQSMGELPPVTVLKPLKGADPQVYENLASFLRQDYPRFQVLFAVQDPSDAVLAVLSKLKRDFSAVDMAVVVSSSRVGLNPKVNNLANAYSSAKHDLLIISDSDVRVGRDFLRRLEAPFQDPALGMVTCFYLCRRAVGLGGALESLAVNAYFLPQALVAGLMLGKRFAMGAAMAIRRSALEASGGFSNLGQYLADDFVLGRLVEAAGYRLEFSNVVVDTTLERSSLSQQFVHLVRWCRTIRVCDPAGYLGSGVLHATAFALGYLAVGGSTAPALLLLSLVARVGSVTWIHLTQFSNSGILAQLPFVPLSELVQFAAWVFGFGPRRVVWRDETYRITRDGRFVPNDSEGRAVVSAG